MPSLVARKALSVEGFWGTLTQIQACFTMTVAGGSFHSLKASISAWQIKACESRTIHLMAELKQEGSKLKEHVKTSGATGS